LGDADFKFYDLYLRKKNEEKIEEEQDQGQIHQHEDVNDKEDEDEDDTDEDENQNEEEEEDTTNTMTKGPKQEKLTKKQAKEQKRQPFYKFGGFTSDYPFWYPDNHNEQFYNDLISGEPEFSHFQLNPETDSFLIIACDGLWDVLSPEEAVEVVEEYLKEQNNNKIENDQRFDQNEENQNSSSDANYIATKLGDLALRLGSSDNVTVLVVLFEWE